VRDDISMLDRHIQPRIGAMRVTEIAKRDVIRLLDEVAAQPDARKGSKPDRKMTHRPNRVFELVRAIFRWAIGRDLLTVDPTLGLAPPIRKEKPRERDLSPDEIRRLWASLDKAPIGGTARHSEGNFPMTRPTALAIKLALVTGQRIGEVANISLSELSLDHAAPLWMIPGDRTKNGHPNRVPLSPLALKLIAEASELAGESPWLFPSPNGDGPIDAHAPTRALARARDAIGLEDFRIHDLRRTAATRMAELGISPHTISMILNHVSARQGTLTSKVYVQYSYDHEKREALMAWSARLEEITSTERRHKGPERLLRRLMA
jgi:integrase